MCMCNISNVCPTIKAQSHVHTTRLVVLLATCWIRYKLFWDRWTQADRFVLKSLSFCINLFIYELFVNAAFRYSLKYTFQYFYLLIICSMCTLSFPISFAWLLKLILPSASGANLHRQVFILRDFVLAKSNWTNPTKETSIRKAVGENKCAAEAWIWFYNENILTYINYCERLSGLKSHRCYCCYLNLYRTWMFIQIDTFIS